jgi:hypothetical protein
MTDTARAELEKLGAPQDVVASLLKLRDELSKVAGANLAGLVIYGGLARGRFTPGKSDVNLAVLLRDASAPELEKIAPALRAAFRSLRVAPFFLTPPEVAHSADVFPTKFLDIRDHHVVLAGEDPFAGLAIAREHIRLRVEQELRNFSLRLRRRFVSAWDDPDALAGTLAEVAAPLSIELLALVELAGKEAPAEGSLAAAFGAAARAFDLDADALAKLAALKAAATADDGTPALYGRILAQVARAAEIADGLFEEKKP